MGDSKHRPADLRNSLNIREDGRGFSSQCDSLQIESLGEQSLVTVKQKVAWLSIGRVGSRFNDESLLVRIQRTHEDAIYAFPPREIGC